MNDATKPALLVVDDDEDMCQMLQSRLTARGYSVVSRTSPTEALRLVQEEDFAVVVTDVRMKGMDGLELCKQLVSAQPNLPVIITTGFGNMELAIAAIRVGAYDFLPKPFEIDQLVLAIERGITLARLKDEVKRLRFDAAESDSFDALYGQSEKMRELYTLLSKVAKSNAAVLITGESGTGKELVARALHNKSARQQGPFVAINCAAMPEALLESELFGHARGAFTDAKVAKEGLFVVANGGTLFLDEVGELPLALQAKLLRALQEHVVRPVGGTQEINFDARVVTATNRDLEQMVKAKTFREDLFFRVNVISVVLPPLRDRGEDILLLAQQFIERFSAREHKRIVGLQTDAAEKLTAYSWPGNVRELQNCVEHAIALANFDHITVGDLPTRIQDARAVRATFAAVPLDAASPTALEDVEKRHVCRVLQQVSGNKSAAARLLGIERKTLYRMLERWGLADEYGS